MTPDTTKSIMSSATVTVKNVRLPQSALNAAIACGVPSSASKHGLVDIEYRRGKGWLKVYMKGSDMTPTSKFDASAPFQSICSVEHAENDASASSLPSWTCVAQFENMPVSDLPFTNTVIDAAGSVAVPGGLCHPHLHLDKCFLLDRCQISKGTFDEAMSSTASAKVDFSHDDLVSRGRRLISYSVSHGVTSIRAHVEVDPTVQHLCLQAGTALQVKFKSICDIQLVAFAQDPLMYPQDTEKEQEMARLMEQAASKSEVSAIGSAPYVESSDGGQAKQVERQKQNIRTVFDLAARFGKDIDLHLDYDLDAESESLILYALSLTAQHSWKVNARPRRITLGHCTKMSVFSASQIEKVRIKIDTIPLEDGVSTSPVSFVALPPSDLYMQGRSQPYAVRSRATLPLLDLPDHFHAHLALGVNNVANLFTPQGDADPLALLPSAVAIWQDATQCPRLMDFVSTQARFAAGLHADYPELWKDLTVLDSALSIQNAVLAPPFPRITIKNGTLVSHRSLQSHVVQSRA